MSDQPAEGTFTDADRNTVTSTTASSVQYNIFLLLDWHYIIKTQISYRLILVSFFFSISILKITFAEHFTSMLFFFYFSRSHSCQRLETRTIRLSFISVSIEFFQAGTFTVSAESMLKSINIMIKFISVTQALDGHQNHTKKL